MTDQPDQMELEPRILVVIDGVGDPYVSVNIQMPPGAALAADQCDQLALKLLAAAAAARVRAGVIRGQMLGGASHAEALRFTSDVLGNP